MLIQAANRGTVEWPITVVDSFETLRALANENIVVEIDDPAALLVTTASTEDVLVFLGAFVAWHLDNDQCFESAAQNADRWLSDRTECVVQFDRHWCATAVDIGNGFYGDLVRTVDFLDNEPLAAVLAQFVDSAVASGDETTIDCLCDALIGQESSCSDESIPIP